MYTHKTEISNLVQGSFLTPGYAWYIYDPTFYKLPEGAQNLTVSVTRASGRDVDISVRFYSDMSEDAQVDTITKASYFRVQMSDELGATIRPEDVTECYAISTWEWGIVDGKLTNDYLPDAIVDYMKEPYPYAAWKIKSYLNNGSPYHDFLKIPIFTPAPPVPQREYITVYDRLSTVETFDTHGLAVLSPTKCEITEEYQGKWTLVIEHPRDADRKHEFIKPFNIVKAMGQLFSIVSVSDKIPGLITAKAEHIFYHLNDRWIFPGSRIISASVAGLMLSAKLASSDYSTDDQISYDFDFTSDIANSDLGVKSNAKWGYTREGMSLAEFVLGSGNLLEMSGGELYRDNFHYSIFERMENSNDNAFEIRVGKDLTGITRTVDISQMCTYFRAYNGLDNSLGTWFAISYTDAVAGSVAPHSVIRSKIFNPQLPFWIKDEDEIAEMSDALVADEAMRFFKENCKPIVKYEVDIEDVNKNPDFSELKNLPDYRVGNIGTIYDERLGVQATLKITKTIKNAITGKTISVVFGELVGETEIIERTEALRTADMEVLATADGETLYTKK